MKLHSAIKPSSKIYKMLESFEVQRTAVLLLHSAFKTFALDGYKAEETLKAFVDYMKPGTLLLPTMSWRFVKPSTPFFDELETPSNTGILTEIFRRHYASKRSLHPTHSVAGCGKDAEEILGTHHYCVTPCGLESPFGKLVNFNANIVMFGVGMDCCSMIHHVEERYAEKYYVHPETKTENYLCRDRNNLVTEVKLRRHLFLPRNYWQFQDKMASNEELKVYRCDNSICLGFSAKNLCRSVTSTLRENPNAIIAKTGQRYRLM